MLGTKRMVGIIRVERLVTFEDEDPESRTVSVEFRT